MAEERTNSVGAAELLVDLQRALPTPLSRQLEAGIRERIRQGHLRAGVVLPPTRVLASDLGLSRGVVVEAYGQLVAEGYLVSRTGGYTQVAGVRPTQPAQPAHPPAAPALRVDFRYGRPDVSQFPRAAWLRSLRRVLNEIPNDRLVYLDGRGAPELHQGLADYLNRVRGTSARAENIVISNGFGQGIRLLAQVLAANGHRCLAVEDPSSDDDIRVIAPAAGVRIIGIPVGPGGIDVDALDRSDADAVLVTAAHQFPTGAVLSSESRNALVSWAVRRNALIIEDDYDAEYRYDREPIGAIQGLAPEHVVYAGTVSKTLAPGLRLGWLVLPAHLVADVAAAKLVDDRGSPVLEQLTFADFVARGEFDRHLRRMRPRYRERRDVLLNTLTARLPDFEATGISAGLHVVTWLPPDLAEAAVVDAAAARGLGVYGLRPYRMSPGRAGLLFGYGNVSPAAIRDGIGLLADVVSAIRARRHDPPSRSARRADQE
jgi:GntR family transcriptional regulator/MocR family aminotransferase